MPCRLSADITDRPAVGPYRFFWLLPLNRDSLSSVSLFVSHNFPAEGQNPRIGLSCFGFGDIPVAHIHLRKARPGQQIIGLESHGLESAADGLSHLTKFE